MRVTRLSGSEGGGILCDSPYPYSDSGAAPVPYPTAVFDSSTWCTAAMQVAHGDFSLESRGMRIRTDD